MNQIIPVLTETWKGIGQVNCVNARELHQFLGSKKNFGNWIRNRIKRSGFTENTDFIKFNQLVKSNSKARIEYHVLLRMAKELSMIEQTDRGREARLYFIDCEERLLKIESNSSAQHPFLQYNDKDRADLQRLMELEIKGSDHAWAFLNAIVPFTEKTKKSSKTVESKYIPHGSHETTLIDCVLGWWRDQGKDSIEIGSVKFFYALQARPDWPVDGPRGANWLTQRLRGIQVKLLKYGIGFEHTKKNDGRTLYFYLDQNKKRGSS